MKKIFLICLTILLAMPCVALAKKNDGLPEEDRIKVVVEITNSSRYKELNPAQSLENFLSGKLGEKNLITVVDAKTFGDAEKISDAEAFRDENFSAEPFRDGDENFSADKQTVDTMSPAENIGELLVFDAVEIPRASDVAKNFDAAAYADSGAKYIVRCEVLGIGATKVNDKALELVTGIVGGGLNLGGSGNSNRDKTLRRVGTGIALLGFGSMLDVTKRTALNTVVNMQFIDATTGTVLWQENFVGKAIKHHRPDKGYNNVWEQAYLESVENSAKDIAKRVNKYIDRVVIKGKSDKSFMPKNFKLGVGLGGGKLF